MGRLIDIAGQRFGLLVAIEKVVMEGDTRAYWRCVCDCGGESVCSGKNLRTGITRSCGCLQRAFARGMGANPEFISKRASAVTRHGHKRRGKTSAEYKTWLAIKKRCSTPSSKDFANWGGRGISVCERWNESFEAFLEDMGPRPTARHQIDRKDSNGNYEPNNCRWVTPSIQGKENKRSNVPVEVDGMKFQSIAAACRHFGVKQTAANYRIKSGVAVEDAVRTQPHGAPPRRSRESYLARTHPDRAD